MTTSVKHLKVPAFDLTWYEIIQNDRPYVFVLIPGGGGSAKTGVKNQIMMGKAAYPPGKEFEFEDSYLTDADGLTSLCTGVTYGVIEVFLNGFCSCIYSRLVLSVSYI
jgi:hypothetical protein